MESQGTMECDKEKVKNVDEAMKVKPGEGLEAEIEPMTKKYHEVVALEIVNFSNGSPYEIQVHRFVYIFQPILF